MKSIVLLEVNKKCLHRSGKLPLRLFLVLPFVLQILAAVGLVGYLSFRNGQKAVNDLATQLIERASQQVDTHLDAYLSQPTKLTQMNVDAIANRELDLSNAIASGRFFWKQVKAFPGISAIGYVSLKTEEFGAARLSLAGEIVVFENLGEGINSDYAADDQGNRTKLLQRYEYQYDPLAQDWYRADMPIGKLH
jgi:CHASE1-domain containing sensor protein